MNKQEISGNSTPKRVEIDFMILGKKLWLGRRTILICLIAGTVLGLGYAIFTPKEFTVTTTMLPQGGAEKSLSGFSSLAAIAGFDLNIDAGSDITPVVYPQIIESAPFMLDLMNTKYTFSDIDHPVTMYQYYTKLVKPSIFDLIMKYTLGLPGVIINAVRKTPKVVVIKSDSSMITILTKEQDQIMRSLINQINLYINKKDGFLTLTCRFHEALLTAQVAERAQDLLQKNITEYKIKKSSQQLNFIEQRYIEKKRDYEIAQNRLAGYRDRNQNVSSASANTELDRLQNEYSIAYSVYSELAKQLEQAKIQVKNETPVFVILKPIVVPLEKTKPKRFTLLAAWMLVGFIFGIGVVTGREYWAFVRNKTKQ